MAGILNEDDTPRTGTHMYGGIRFPWFVPASSLDALKDFEVRPDDTWIMTFSKSGTTWITEVVLGILAGGDYNKYDPHVDPVPYPEFKVGPKPNYQILAEAPSPRLIVSHLNPALLPRQFNEKKPKVIYVARNPKDVCLSYFYHMQVAPAVETLKPFDEFLEEFLNGSVLMGDWPSHVLYWWDKRNDDNVLFLKYENMKLNLNTAVEKVATFLGYSLSESQVKTIAKWCDFDAMKHRKVKAKDHMCDAFAIDKSKSPFVRIGQVGTWKHQLTVAQNELFDNWYAEVVKDTGLSLDFTV